jgi:protein-tyrosine phosphatase
MPKKILFLCTGNYYRSRYAEIYFNWVVLRNTLDWRAFSCALALEKGSGNVGPISPYARAGLKKQGIPLHEPVRFPVQVQEKDLSEADIIIALKEEEHRPLMQQRFPAWEDKVEYWHVRDLDNADYNAVPHIEQNIEELVKRLDAKM